MYLHFYGYNQVGIEQFWWQSLTTETRVSVLLCCHKQTQLAR